MQLSPLTVIVLGFCVVLIGIIVHRLLTVTVSRGYGDYTSVRIGFSAYQINPRGEVIEEGPFCTFCVTDRDTIYNVNRYACMLDDTKSITVFRSKGIL